MKTKLTNLISILDVELDVTIRTADGIIYNGNVRDLFSLNSINNLYVYYIKNFWDGTLLLECRDY